VHSLIHPIIVHLIPYSVLSLYVPGAFELSDGIGRIALLMVNEFWYDLEWAMGAAASRLFFPLFWHTLTDTYTWVPDAISHDTGGYLLELTGPYTRNWVKTPFTSGCPFVRLWYTESTEHWTSHIRKVHVPRSEHPI